MSRNMGLKIVGYITHFFNFSSTMIAIAMIILGVTTYSKAVKYESVIDIKISPYPAFLIALGCCILIASFVSSFGVIKKNAMILLSFLIISSAIIVCESIYIGTAYGKIDVTHGNIFASLNGTFNETFYGNCNKNNTNATLYEQWNNLQTDFQCCGMNGANDFKPYNCTSYPSPCCKNIQQNETCNAEWAKNSTVQGCDLALRPHNADVNIELKTMAGVTIGSLTSQILTAISSGFLFFKFQKEV